MEKRTKRALLHCSFVKTKEGRLVLESGIGRGSVSIVALAGHPVGAQWAKTRAERRGALTPARPLNFLPRLRALDAVRFIARTYLPYSAPCISNPARFYHLASAKYAPTYARRTNLSLNAHRASGSNSFGPSRPESPYTTKTPIQGGILLLLDTGSIIYLQIIIIIKLYTELKCSMCWRRTKHFAPAAFKIQQILASLFGIKRPHIEI